MRPQMRIGLKRLAIPVFLLAGALAPPLFAGSRELVSPSPGQTLAAGDELRVRWEGAPGAAKEWEAFLSLDGGKTFPIRVTPHLSVGVRSFAWTVPQLYARDARLRLRFGDEEVEEQIDFSAPFSIVPSRGGRILEGRAGDLGAAPFPGEEQNTAWVEGTLFGGDARVVVPPAPAGIAPSSSWASAGTRLRFSRGRTAVLPAPSGSRPHRPADPQGFVAPARGESARSILNSISRLNV